MLIERPEKPQGRHVWLLRNHLGGISQTLFAALLESAQTTVSLWEHPDKRDEFLPPALAERFLEVWDCLPSPPADYTEMMAAVAAHRMRKAGLSAPGQETGEKLVRLVPEDGVLAGAPRIYWRRESSPSEEGRPREPSGGTGAAGDAARAPEAKGAHTAPDREPSRPAFRVQLSILTLSVLFAVWSARGKAKPGTTAATQATRRPRFRRWASAASLLALLVPVACFQNHQALRGEPLLGPFMSEFSTGAGEMGEKTSAERYIPSQPLPGQKHSPCNSERREEAINGGCWGRLAGPPPCGRYLYRSENACFLPIAADPKQPVGEAPVSTKPEKACEDVLEERRVSGACRQPGTP